MLIFKPKGVAKGFQFFFKKKEVCQDCEQDCIQNICSTSFALSERPAMGIRMGHSRSSTPTPRSRARTLDTGRGAVHGRCAASPHLKHCSASLIVIFLLAG